MKSFGGQKAENHVFFDVDKGSVLGFETGMEINQSGVTEVLVEQKARVALKLAHRGYVMEVGNTVLQDSAEALLANPVVRAAYLDG